MIKTAFLPFIDSESEILILGTFPSEKSLDTNEYYGNKQNQFWKLIYDVFETDYEPVYSERLLFLKENKIALWDVFQTCERKGSLDANIVNPEVNDFEKLFAKYPNLNKIVFSSKNADSFYRKRVGNYFGKEILIMPSTSGLYASMKYQDKLEIWKTIK